MWLWWCVIHMWFASVEHFQLALISCRCWWPVLSCLPRSSKALTTFVIHYLSQHAVELGPGPADSDHCKGCLTCFTQIGMWTGIEMYNYSDDQWCIWCILSMMINDDQWWLMMFFILCRFANLRWCANHPLDLEDLLPTFEPLLAFCSLNSFTQGRCQRSTPLPISSRWWPTTTRTPPWNWGMVLVNGRVSRLD